MAQSALLAVAKLAAESYLKDVQHQIKGEKYGDASKTIEVILAAQKESFQKVEKKVEQTVAQSKLDEEFNQINLWTALLQKRLAKAEKGSKDDLNALYTELKSGTTGIAKRLYTVDTLLRGTASEYSNRGLIGLYLDKLYDDLKSEDKLDYTIERYLLDTAKYLEAHVKIQKLGLELQIAACDANDDVDSLDVAMKATLVAQVKYAYDNWPAMIRKLKSTFDAPMDPIHWWRFREIKGSKKKVLSRMRHFGLEQPQLSTSDKPPCPHTEWRFVPSLDSPGPTEILIRTANKSLWISEWWNQGAPGIPGMWQVQLEPTGMWQRIKFKIVPEKDSQEPRFRLLTHRDSIRENWSFRDKWDLEDNGVGQWD